MHQRDTRGAEGLLLEAEHLYKSIKRLWKSTRVTSEELASYKKRLRAASNTLDVYRGSRCESLSWSLSKFLRLQGRVDSGLGGGHRFTLNEKVQSLHLFKRSGLSTYASLSKWFVLPSTRALLSLLSRLSSSTGLNDKIFNHLSTTVGNTWTGRDQYCVLMLCKVRLSPWISYSKKLDLIEGLEDLGLNRRAPRLADRALIFVVGGLRRPYKLPVAFVLLSGTIETVTLSKLIQGVISNLNTSGLKVLAMVCDHKSRNIAVINYLCAETMANCLSSGRKCGGDYFMVDGCEVMPLFDPPHLLKGIRNRLLDEDLKFSMGGEEKTASWRHIIQFYAIDQDECKMVPHLKDIHVIPEKIRKTRVESSAAVFHQRLAAFMAFLARRNDPDIEPSARDTAHLLVFFCKLCDSVNGQSRHPIQHDPLKCAVTSTSGHVEFWAEAVKVLESIVFADGEKQSKTPLIENWVRTLRNMKAIWLKLRSNGFRILCTGYLNGGTLGKKLRCLRKCGIGGNTPTYAEFVGAYKVMLLNDLVEMHHRGAQGKDKKSKMMGDLRNCLKNSRSSNSSHSTDTTHVSGDNDVDLSSEADVLQRLGPVNCAECSQNLYASPQSTPSAEFVRVYQSSAAMVRKYLPAVCHKSGVGAYLRNMLESYTNVSSVACNDHRSEFVKRFCSVVVENVIALWCDSVNGCLSGESPVSADQMDDVHRMACEFYVKRRRSS